MPGDTSEYKYDAYTVKCRTYATRFYIVISVIPVRIFPFLIVPNELSNRDFKAISKRQQDEHAAQSDAAGKEY